MLIAAGQRQVISAMPDEPKNEVPSLAPKPEAPPPTATEQIAAHHLDAGHHHGHAQLPPFRFIDEFKRRNVGRVAILYVVVSYVVLEVFEMFFHLLEMPPWSGRIAVLIAIVGFPIALLIAWAYEITPEGLKATEEVAPHKSIARQTGRRLDRAIIVVLGVALLYFVVDKFWLSGRIGAGASPTRMPDAESARPHPPPAAATIIPAISDRSLAVLPFVDMSEKHDQEYFADGMSEELIDRLVRAPELKVIARTSSFQFKGRNEDVRSIANKLAVAHVLEGSVRKSGQILRVTVQLIRATDGMHLWSKTYDRKLGNVFKMQDEIAAAVTEALNTTLSLAVSSDSVAPNMEAYNLVLQGNFLKSRWNAADLQKALELYQQAIVIDPRYAMAWARLGSTYFDQSTFASGVTSAELIRKAREAIQHSLQLDPKLVAGYYTSSGIAMSVDWNWNAVTAALVKMYEIDPGANDLLANAQADVAGLAGDFEYALRLKATSLARDPINPYSLADVAWAQLNLRQYQAALVTNQRLIDLDPKYEGVWTQRAWILLWSGHPAESLEAIAHETDLEAKLAFQTIAHWQHHETQRSTDEWHELIRLYGTQHLFDVAEAAACRGDANVAFEWLDRAFAARDIGTTGIRGDFCLDGLRDDARYKSLVVRLGLDQIVYKSEDLRRLADAQASATKL